MVSLIHAWHTQKHCRSFYLTRYPKHSNIAYHHENVICGIVYHRREVESLLKIAKMGSSSICLAHVQSKTDLLQTFSPYIYSLAYMVKHIFGWNFTFQKYLHNQPTYLHQMGENCDTMRISSIDHRDFFLRFLLLGFVAYLHVYQLIYYLTSKVSFLCYKKC